MQCERATEPQLDWEMLHFDAMTECDAMEEFEEYLNLAYLGVEADDPEDGWLEEERAVINAEEANQDKYDVHIPDKSSQSMRRRRCLRMRSIKRHLATV